MWIKFWGTRGSIPTPGPGTLRYGGNTACVEVRAADGQLLILDCGTGLRQLGKSLAGDPQPITADILLSHTHWDHIQGLPFFAPAFRKDNHFTLYATAGVNQRVVDVLSLPMDYMYFPLGLAELAASLSFKHVGEETFSVGGLQVKTQCLNHTSLTLAYRIASGGVSMVYVADHEAFSPGLYRSGVVRPSEDDIVHAGDRKHVEFLRGADLVIHDAQYTEAEYLTKRNWGHSTAEYAVDVCIAAGVRQVALTHHDPDRDDDAVQRIEAACQERAQRMGSPLKVIAAAEGMEIVLSERAVSAPAGVIQALAVDRLQPACILVVDDDPDMLEMVRAVLARDGYQLLMADDGDQALEIVERHRPDLIILDVMMPRMNGYQVLQQLRATAEFQDIPVLMFTARAGEEDIVRSFAGGVTDYVSKPVTPALLRARVRRWLLGAEQRG